MSEHVLVFGRLGFIVRRLEDLAGDLIEQTRCMPLGLVFLGEFVAFSFHREAMEDLGAGDVAQIAHHLHKSVHIVAVDRTEVPEAEGFEQVALLQQRRLDRVLHFGDDFLRVGSELADLAEHLPHLVLHLVVGMGGGDVGEVFL